MNVLILEDDPILRSVWDDCVSSYGYQTFCVESIKAAFDNLHIRQYDLLLIDLHLEDGNSVGVSHYAKTIQPNCKIIMITGKMVFQNGDHLQQAPGVDWLLRKPVSLADLGALIEYASEQARPQHEMQN